MAVKIPISAAAAGAAGSPYLNVLKFLASAITTGKVFTDANFSGLGAYLPCWLFVALVPAATGTATIQISSDNGTTWVTLYQATNALPAGGLILADSATTVRVVITTAVCDVYLFPVGL